MTGTFLENATITPAIVPVDLQTGANQGDWVSFENYERCLIVLFKAIGTAGDDPVFKLQQATDASGTGAKDVNFTTIYHKLDATDVHTVADFTKATQTAATSYTDATSAEKEGLICVELKAVDLDRDNDFDFFALDVADVGANAQLGCAFYIFYGGRYAQATPPDTIA